MDSAIHTYWHLLGIKFIQDAHKSDTDTIQNNVFLYLKYLSLKNLAAIFQDTKKMNKALEYYLMAVEFDDKDPTIWYCLGKVALQLHQLHIARQAFEQTLCLSPNHIPCKILLIELLMQIGEDHDAHFLIKSALKLKHQRILQLQEEINKPFQQRKLDFVQLETHEEIIIEDEEIITLDVSEISWVAFLSDFIKFYHHHTSQGKNPNQSIKIHPHWKDMEKSNSSDSKNEDTKKRKNIPVETQKKKSRKMEFLAEQMMVQFPQIKDFMENGEGLHTNPEKYGFHGGLNEKLRNFLHKIKPHSIPMFELMIMVLDKINSLVACRMEPELLEQLSVISTILINQDVDIPPHIKLFIAELFYYDYKQDPSNKFKLNFVKKYFGKTNLDLLMNRPLSVCTLEPVRSLWLLGLILSEEQPELAITCFTECKKSYLEFHTEPVFLAHCNTVIISISMDDQVDQIKKQMNFQQGVTTYRYNDFISSLVYFSSTLEQLRKTTPGMRNEIIQILLDSMEKSNFYALPLKNALPLVEFCIKGLLSEGNYTKHNISILCKYIIKNIYLSEDVDLYKLCRGMLQAIYSLVSELEAQDTDFVNEDELLDKHRVHPPYDFILLALWSLSDYNFEFYCRSIEKGMKKYVIKREMYYKMVIVKLFKLWHNNPNDSVRDEIFTCFHILYGLSFDKKTSKSVNSICFDPPKLLNEPYLASIAIHLVYLYPLKATKEEHPFFGITCFPFPEQMKGQLENLHGFLDNKVRTLTPTIVKFQYYDSYSKYFFILGEDIFNSMMKKKSILLSDTMLYNCIENLEKSICFGNTLSWGYLARIYSRLVDILKMGDGVQRQVPDMFKSRLGIQGEGIHEEILMKRACICFEVAIQYYHEDANLFKEYANVLYLQDSKESIKAIEIATILEENNAQYALLTATYKQHFDYPTSDILKDFERAVTFCKANFKDVPTKELYKHLIDNSFYFDSLYKYYSFLLEMYLGDLGLPSEIQWPNFEFDSPKPETGAFTTGITVTDFVFPNDDLKNIFAGLWKCLELKPFETNVLRDILTIARVGLKNDVLAKKIILSTAFIHQDPQKTSKKPGQFKVQLYTERLAGRQNPEEVHELFDGIWKVLLELVDAFGDLTDHSDLITTLRKNGKMLHYYYKSLESFYNYILKIKEEGDEQSDKFKMSILQLWIYSGDLKSDKDFKMDFQPFKEKCERLKNLYFSTLPNIKAAQKYALETFQKDFKPFK